MRIRSALALTLALASAGPLPAQDASNPQRGKIDGVEREKDKDRSDGSSSDCGCGSAWWIELGGDVIHLFTPRGTGRGYRAYPYARDDSADTDSPFLVRHTARGRSFGTVSLSVFDDAGSTLAAGRFAFEGAAALAYWSFELGGYREPLATHTDHLYTWRLGVGVVPRPGPGTMLRIGVAARGLILDDGSSSEGPELELGAQFLPRRPFGAAVTGRLAALSWDGGSDLFALRELNTTGSIFLGRLELQAGWHWMKVGSAPAFGGPVVGTRLWF